MINSCNKSLFGFNLKFKNAFTNSVKASSTSPCIAFSSANTSFALSNAGNIACHDDSIYLLSSKPLIWSTCFCNAVLSPLKNSNICITFASRSKALSTSLWVALVFAYISLAFVKASLNSVTTAGMTFSKSAFLAISMAICKANLSVSIAFLTNASLALIKAVLALSICSWVTFSLSKTALTSKIASLNLIQLSTV